MADGKQFQLGDENQTLLACQVDGTVVHNLEFQVETRYGNKNKLVRH
jgi:hypothetical protein